jgi:hypothetical protein
VLGTVEDGAALGTDQVREAGAFATFDLAGGIRRGDSVLVPAPTSMSW